MHIIDTHNHIYLPEFDNDRNEVIARSKDAGVVAILMPNIDLSSVGPMLETQKQYAGYCLPMMGMHPTSVKDTYKTELELIEKYFDENSFIGVGETGIDLYWDKTFFSQQVDAFRIHLSIAYEHNLPVIIHSRDSLEFVYEELERFGRGRLRGILHAFPGSNTDARKAVEMGFTLGIGGVVTFRNSRTGEAALAAGLDNIVIETDAPYLTPAPFRGKRNESSYLRFVTGKLAELFNVSAEEVAEKTTANAKRLFNIRVSE